jgi:hypothetical protein
MSHRPTSGQFAVACGVAGLAFGVMAARSVLALIAGVVVLAVAIVLYFVIEKRSRTR